MNTSDPLTRADMMGLVSFVLRVGDFVNTAKLSMGGSGLDITIYDAFGISFFSFFSFLSFPFRPSFS